MIRKLNLGLLAFLPLLVLLFGVLSIRTASATTYVGGCPNVIGSVENCEPGWSRSIVDYVPTCHTMTFQYGPGLSGTNCCQYDTQRYTCVNDADPLLSRGFYQVEYFRSQNYTACLGSGVCGYTSA